MPTKHSCPVARTTFAKSARTRQPGGPATLPSSSARCTAAGGEMPWRATNWKAAPTPSLRVSRGLTPPRPARKLCRRPSPCGRRLCLQAQTASCSVATAGTACALVWHRVQRPLSSPIRSITGPCMWRSKWDDRWCAAVFIFCFLFFVLSFLLQQPLPMAVARLRVESELQPQVYAIATARPVPSLRFLEPAPIQDP